jgi:hypothetical protein
MIICRRVLGAQVLRDVLCGHRAEGDKILRLGHGREPSGLPGAGLSEQPDGKPGVAGGLWPASAAARTKAVLRAASGVGVNPALAASLVNIAVSWPGT